MSKNLTIAEWRWFVLGIIDGVVQNIKNDIEALKYTDPLGVKILKEEKKKWLEEREKVFNQIKGRGTYEHIS